MGGRDQTRLLLAGGREALHGLEHTSPLSLSQSLLARDSRLGEELLSLRFLARHFFFPFFFFGLLQSGFSVAVAEREKRQGGIGLGIPFWGGSGSEQKPWLRAGSSDPLARLAVSQQISLLLFQSSPPSPSDPRIHMRGLAFPRRSLGRRGTSPSQHGVSPLPR